MKIKQVCEATGLTDRAIRYYIEEELLSPPTRRTTWAAGPTTSPRRMSLP